MTDYYRRRGALSRATEALAGEPVAVLGPEDSAAEEELAQCLRLLIATLPETYEASSSRSLKERLRGRPRSRLDFRFRA